MCSYNTKTHYLRLAMLSLLCSTSACDGSSSGTDDPSTVVSDATDDSDEVTTTGDTSDSGSGDSDLVDRDIGDSDAVADVMVEDELDVSEEEASVDVPPDPSDDVFDVSTPWGPGDLQISGQAFFFDMETVGVIDWIREVEGAVVYIVEAPERRAVLDSANNHVFTFDEIPRDVEATLAITAPGYMSHLTSTFTVSDQSIEGVTFQVVSLRIGDLISMLLGIDNTDETRCQMATTVTAAGGDSIWAAGEPGATVTIEPEVPSRFGPTYFNTSVIPDPSLSETTTDGGVVVAGVEPGMYIWRGHKDGVTFTELRMRCIGGWITNASPPWGMNVIVDE